MSACGTLSIAAATECALVRIEQNAELGLTDARGVCQHGSKYRLQFAGRTADDLEHLGGGRLLLQRLGKLAVRACTSSNRRTFSIAITAWSAKVVTSSICLSVNGRTSWRPKIESRQLACRSRSRGTPRNVRNAAYSDVIAK